VQKFSSRGCCRSNRFSATQHFSPYQTFGNNIAGPFLPNLDLLSSVSSNAFGIRLGLDQSRTTNPRQVPHTAVSRHVGDHENGLKKVRAIRYPP
jgi:hypothetical protein